MTKAPKRIFTVADTRSSALVGLGEWDIIDNGEGVEYTRADIAQAQVTAAIEQAVAMCNWENWTDRLQAGTPVTPAMIAERIRRIAPADDKSRDPKGE